MSKRIVILGGGESGVGAAILAKTKGFEVFLSDKGNLKDKYKTILNDNSIKWEEKQHTEELILNADTVIKSPGIPDKAEIVRKLKEKNIPIISEIEFAGRYTNAKIIGITGSNGKTTTTLLIYHIFKKAGLNVGLAGNVGQSFAYQVATENFDIYVLELSSFQLDGMFDFKVDVAILTNITPDHLDRYDYNFQNYIDSKLRIIQNQTENDYFIYCQDDEVTMNEIVKRKILAQKFPFTLAEKAGNGAHIKNEELIININNNTFNMILHDLALHGKHNTYNSMAAGIAAHVFKIRKDTIRESLFDFQGVEHRLEPVIKVHGIQYINDSKATNVNSTWYALESMNSKVVWLAGGIDKGNDYETLIPLVKEKVKAIICIGTDNSKIHKAFKKVVENIIDVSSIEEAVQKSYYLAKKGETVLLSPACASFDLFENYEERGRRFKKAVRNL
ncbi:MAG: UDP-N-acetylmuramoylalanine--D-glutamate ligase [Bacteroidetes bacterium GWF2_33_38]|nr:MAG: UDP-N-acetylmuramoylalanine--D-glutamate ligase [Bacteroidetes bacterium GWF2_33_38]OFY73505.1 MAG: UDP-N-acetylmuramoylalanine--D-glutamate ligase [Bacteroidetes bacterium RIFOXYA12_FULL_33_9]OFY90006.1 MAG: UDP-N-acetylmuramoylalanine--D-glutamate ligase [Bacteroidetes bacterium RIFOXYA2_FULL_33_7]